MRVHLRHTTVPATTHLLLTPEDARLKPLCTLIQQRPFDWRPCTLDNGELAVTVAGERSRRAVLDSVVDGGPSASFQTVCRDARVLDTYESLTRRIVETARFAAMRAWGDQAGLRAGPQALTFEITAPAETARPARVPRAGVWL